MAANSHTTRGNGASRRRVPRFRMQEPLYVIVSRSGVEDRMPGRTVNVCERGISAVLAGELVPGESVGVEVKLSTANEPLRAQAMVRYQDKLRCGLEFAPVSAEQRSAIRGWARQANAEISIGSQSAFRGPETEEIRKKSSDGPPPRRRWAVWVAAALFVAIMTAAAWWRWNRGWAELESGLRSAQTFAAERPRAQVPAEVMQELLVHRVEPTYPLEARKQNLQGVIALDIVVGRDGSVLRMRPLNGPSVLADAAMAALRWWKFEPYLLDGEPAAVETTVAVEFKN